MSDRRWLALCGSLRSASSNRALLLAAQQLAPAGVNVVLYEGLAGLPPFNPDIEEGNAPLPPPVGALRRAVGEAEALLVACPEYAHGVPGSFKNLLDWLVGSLEFPNKPVVLFNAAARAHHAQAQLAETLHTMNARLLLPTPYLIALPRNDIDATAILDEPDLSASLRAALADVAMRLTRN
jgi:NAD(P)H-dependent FMN reductase